MPFVCRNICYLCGILVENGLDVLVRLLESNRNRENFKLKIQMKARNLIAVATAMLLLGTAQVSAQWKPVGDKIKTPWAEKVNSKLPWNVYPRPQLKRTQWVNLNGLWNYAIKDLDSTEPAAFDGKILVPYPIESALSGVGKYVSKNNILWYNRTFSIPSAWKGKNVKLNFGAVDWKAEVFVNGVSVGNHTGGFAPFSFDITSALKAGVNKLSVKVFDPSSDGYQPVGKQRSKSQGIWYTPASGIWQTVWLEPVNAKHIENLDITSDIDAGKLTVKPFVSAANADDQIQITAKFAGKAVASAKGTNNSEISLDIPNAKLWSPETPNLYSLDIKVVSGGKTVDAVSSYTAMRKISQGKSKSGHLVMMLNNKPMFQMGPLDQGYWPDGIYTAPTYEAMVYDIDKTKQWGFNMIRKHMKVEPALWYEYCDKAGIVVWQDMPSGQINYDANDWDMTHWFAKDEMVRSAESEADFRAEWKDIIDNFKIFPCIVVWTPFNEGWGQFKTADITQYTHQLDPTRLINSASGGNHFKGVGDILDLHKYPAPEMYLTDPERVEVMGEFGGLGLPLKGHVWQDSDNWGYVQYKNAKEVTDRYVEIANGLLEMVKKGAAAGVYTQTTDCEVEVNGLMTYDRKVIKVEESRVREANLKLCRSLDNE